MWKEPCMKYGCVIVAYVCLLRSRLHSKFSVYCVIYIVMIVDCPSSHSKKVFVHFSAMNAKRFCNFIRVRDALPNGILQNSCSFPSEHALVKIIYSVFVFQESIDVNSYQVNSNIIYSIVSSWWTNWNLSKVTSRSQASFQDHPVVKVTHSSSYGYPRVRVTQVHATTIQRSKPHKLLLKVIQGLRSQASLHG